MKASFQESSPRTGMQVAAARVRERLLIEQRLHGFRRIKRKKKASEIVYHPMPWDTIYRTQNAFEKSKQRHLASSLQSLVEYLLEITDTVQIQDNAAKR